MAQHHPPRWRQAIVAVCLSSLAVLASAATTTTASATTTSTAPEGPKTHVVLVGSGGDTQYHPNSINASVGDVVSFQFYPTNHSVIRGEYIGSQACGSGGCNPCVPVELIDPTVPSFASKNFLTQDLPTAANMAAQSYNLTVNDTKPIWFYCDAISSCLNGMVGVINPPNASAIDIQVAAAKAAKFQLAPGEPWPAEGSQPGSQGATPSNSSPSNSSSSPASSTTAATTHDHHMTGGAIAGIAVGGAAVVILCATLCYFVGRANTYRDVLRTKHPEGGLPSHYGDGTSGMPTPAAAPPMSPVDMAYHPSVSTPPPGGWDHRFSGQTQFSNLPGMSESVALPAGTFIGYNRATGEPEFMQEAPTLAPGDGEHYHDDAKLAPSPPVGFHGAQDGNAATQQPHELPGETPPVAEVGPYK